MLAKFSSRYDISFFQKSWHIHTVDVPTGFRACRITDVFTDSFESSYRQQFPQERLRLESLADIRCAIVERFITEGAKVFAFARNAEALKALEAAYPGQVSAVGQTVRA
jgi:hypothetical protein